MKNNHILPFLWLHGEDEATLRDMLQKIHASNIGAVCLESRPHPDYVGDQWWHDVDIIIDECLKLGLKIWILDDSHFPTGFANGRMLNESNDLAKQYLAKAHADVCGPIPGGRLNVAGMYAARPNPFANAAAGPFAPKNQRTFDDNSLYSVMAYPIEYKDKLGEPVDLTDKVENGALIWDVPAGAWRIVTTYLTRNGGGNTNYINLLHAESVDILIDEVYEKHWAHYAKYFGNLILGFFSDEPAVGNVAGFNFDERVGYKNMPLPWAPEMPGLLGEDFAKTTGYLWFDGADEEKTVAARLNYMEAATKLISKNFSDRLGKWCEAHGVMYIGHVIEDNNQHMRLGSSCGHFFRSMSGMHMAGIDDIGGQVIPGMQNTLRHRGFGPAGDGEFYHFALGKLGASLAQYDENKAGRTMCEIFGAYGWDEGVREMKFLANHFLVRGVNYYVPHAFTGKDFPDRDCPPHFYAHGHNPQYRHFGQLMPYMNRISDLFDGGKPVIDATILYNAESYWMGDAMFVQQPARALHEAQRDFLFWPVDGIDRLPKKPLIVPACDHLPPKAVQWITANIDDVIFVDRLPAEIAAGKVVALDNLAEAIPAHMDICHTIKGLRFYHYQGDEEAVMFFNEDMTAGAEFTVALPEGAFYDAHKDRYVKACAKDGRVYVKLIPGEACVYVFGKTADVEPITGEKTELKPVITGYATAEAYPNFGEIPCEEAKFSGTIAYECKYASPAARKALLTVEECTEAIEVFVNGASQGFSIAPPYAVEIELPAGECDVRIEVTNTLGNQQGAYDGGFFSGPTFAPALGILGKVEIIG
ncbi:MAG: hypothetical protein IJC56_02940 [Clostridia bacterium]|nr:hypothetical protein [Clostridia bacterium]